MKFRSKVLYRYMPKANIHYLPDNAIVMSTVGRRGKGIVKVRLDADWVKRSGSRYDVLFRGM